MKTPVALPAPLPAASVSEFIATFAVILAAIVGLLLFDTALANVDSRERKVVANREFLTGERLLTTNGRVDDAVEHLRTAATLDGENSRYGVALAQAVLAQGRAAEAEQMLLPLLESSPNDGAVNLAMARVLAKEGRTQEATSYYHRSIYGAWPRQANQWRSVARSELIDLLAQTNAKQELLAELIPLQDDSASDAAQQKRIAHLFLKAGSPSRAMAIYRTVLRRDSHDAEAYVGLADASLSLGDFTGARADLVAAQKLMPDDSTALAARISVTDSVIALDPTQLGLSLGEQYRRTRNLLKTTLASVRSCLATQAPQVAVALDSATLLLVTPAPADGQGQSIEQTLSLSEQLWGLRRTRCAPEREDGALALIHNRIAQ
jgi:Flp pilus assembly protein TadD